MLTARRGEGSMLTARGWGGGEGYLCCTPARGEKTLPSTLNIWVLKLIIDNGKRYKVVKKMYDLSGKI